jgi:CubicO group peptidase (beta-lactamase class C family)
MRLTVSCCFVLWLATTASADPVDDYVRSQLGPRDLPGVSLAVVRNGRIVKAAGYGLASLELNAPASERTVYEIGSISTQFAADAVLLLAEDGKLSLDDPLSKYLQRTPPAWSAITVRHVLTHPGGLPDFDTGKIGFSYRREYTEAEFVDLLAAHPLDFTPGERWNYTNGFPLLGIVVERASGMPYVDFVRTRIFERLGLASARFKSNTDVVPNRADGYLFEDGAYRHGEMLRPALIAPNGGVLINVLDFAAWDIAITSGRLLSAASMTAMTTPVRLSTGRTVAHGLGWFMDRFNGHQFGAHWGTTVTGHSAVIRRYVDDRVTVIVLANLDDGGLGVDAMSKRIADLYVPGVDLRGLSVAKDAEQRHVGDIRRAVTSIAAGDDGPGIAPGLPARLPEPVRQRIAATLASAVSFESLGGEAVTDRHFNLDPALARLEWYRARTPAGIRYFTIRLDDGGHVIGVLIEDE